MSETLTPLSSVQIRQEFLQIVLRDLRGPAGGEDEFITEQAVRDRYILGLLAPHGQTPLPLEEDEDLALDGTDNEDGKSEPVNVQGRAMFPSAMGMTFTVASEATEIMATAKWGHYDRVASTELGLDLDPPKHVWKRMQIEATTEEPLPLKVGRIKRWTPNLEFPDVYVDGRVRKIAGQWVITLFLVNAQQEPAKLKDTAWVFQPELSVEAPDGEPIFIRRMNVRGNANHEDLSMQMVYRKQVEFAVGHGVATHVELLEGSFERAVRIKTDTAPTYELPKTIAPNPKDVPSLTGVELDMKSLSEIPDGGFSAVLTPLVAAYRIWLTGIESRANSPDPILEPYSPQAKAVVEHCQRVLSRLENAIALLDSNPQAAEAFRFANRSMWQQRIHSLFTQSVRQKKNETLEQIDTPQNRTWYLFQLAFILINLPGMVDPTHPERSDPSSAIADVLWFPTGGGKTEAYLGLTAFTLAIRRLQGKMGEYDGSAGVTVLMRYTLRLLTLQQFQRATALICACELIRKSDKKWGDEPFRIGLWIGQRSTPNWTEESDRVVKEYRRGGSFRSSAVGGSGTPHQLTNCPWCGETIKPGRDIKVELFKAGSGRTLVYCPSASCEFNQRNAVGEGLPVVVVDEEVYRRLPSLLIATVDKFAQMPWKGEVQMLFGKVNAYCPRHGFRSPDIDDTDSHPAHKRSGLPSVKSEERGPLRPPDLIIQDELHLINGPLGTLVGLYETAVDSLSSWEYQGKVVRPKVVASSATIRRATEQVHALYMRKANVFPPPGLDIEDNFFARQITPTEKDPGRLYFGVCAPGVQAKVVMIRVYSAFLSAAQFLYNKYGAAADPYMTLVGYFNAMRELGGLRRLVDDAISTRLRQMEKRGLENRKFNTNSVKELTSRVGATDIPETLDRLNAVFDPHAERDRQARARANEKIDFSDIPIDVLLATNMISVGVDVPRLGLMVVAGQPKYTAEYIQATSRIGRHYPGLVCTVYNWVRPRDLSHFERFEHYHATLYQQVEPLSVTPFSARALDRGLSALLVSYVRLLGEKFNGNRDAGSLKAGHEFILRAMNDISKRATAITSDEDLEAIVRDDLNVRIANWLAHATTVLQGGGVLGYKTMDDGRTVGLLTPPGKERDMFTCLTSLRDVESPVALILNNYELRTPVKIVEGEEVTE